MLLYHNDHVTHLQKPMKYYVKKINKIKDMFDVLVINWDLYPKAKRKLRNCACVLMINDANSANCVNIFCNRAERLKLQTGEIDFPNKFLEIIDSLENLKYFSSSKLRQLRSDIRHHKNTGIVPSKISEINPWLSDEVNTFFESEIYPHHEVIKLNKKIRNKKKLIQKFREDLLKFEGLPPEINAAKIMLNEANLKSFELDAEVEEVRDFYLDTSSSFSS